MKELWVALCLTGMVFANDTAINPGGYAPGPVGTISSEESVIRMVSEKIDITFGKVRSTVKCRFVFRSTKKGEPAKQTVGFPDLLQDLGDPGTIISMITKVDGKEVSAKKQRGWFTEDDNPRGGLGEFPQKGLQHFIADYHTVDVEFPPDQDVIIEREYVVTNGGSVDGNLFFSYTTLTGAIWNGTIGRAEFTVNLDGWTVDDLAFEDGPQKRAPRQQMTFSSPNKSEWKVESPTKLSMVWENFEPAVHRTRREVFLNTWVRDRTKE